MTTASSPETSKKAYAVALFEAVRASLKEDSRQTIHGSWIFGLQFPQLLDELRDTFPGQVLEPPCAEAATAAMGIGAAMTGAPTLIDMATANFSLLAWSQLVNEASVVHYLSNGQLNAPVVFHIMHGLRGGGGAQHSASPQSMLWSVPGLEIVIPSMPFDAKGLLRRAMKSPNPTVFIDHVKLLAMEGDVPDDDYELPFGVAEIKRLGRDVTLVATSYQVHVALGVAETLSAEGIEVEVIDPRTLVPFDEDTIVESVKRTGRIAVLDEGTRRCGVASEIAVTVAEKAHSALKAPVLRLTRADAPVAYSASLESALMPGPEEICVALRALVSADVT